jgi:hypothetical protein
MVRTTPPRAGDQPAADAGDAKAPPWILDTNVRQTRWTRVKRHASPQFSAARLDKVFENVQPVLLCRLPCEMPHCHFEVVLATVG